MYKDKNKQREANREAMRRNRAKGASVIPCDTRVKVIPEDTPNVILCETEAEAGEISDSRIKPNPKRGKDIKCFADLPPDVQRTIDKMSTTDGTLDKDEKAKRTAAAIKYQHVFPHRFESSHDDGVYPYPHVTGKPGDADYNGICTKE